MLDENNPYAKALIGLVVSINNQIPMEKEDQVLLVMLLDSEKKIVAFNEWVKSRLDGEILKATPVEIMAAAQRISETNDHEL